MPLDKEMVMTKDKLPQAVIQLHAAIRDFLSADREHCCLLSYQDPDCEGEVGQGDPICSLCQKVFRAGKERNVTATLAILAEMDLSKIWP